jgi:molybdate transport system substrate-binding protein
MVRFSVLTAAAAMLLLGNPLLAGPASADINVLSPGVAYNAGLVDIAAAYTKKTGTKVTVKSDGMGAIIDHIKKQTPAADVIVLPVSFMDGLEAENGIKPGSSAELGRVYVGLAVKKGTPHPDISTPAKLAAALKTLGPVLYSDPASGSMEARVINDMLHQYPVFKGVVTKISTEGEGGQAVIRGDGYAALQLSCEILNHPELDQVGLLPAELHAYIDTAVAVSARASDAAAAQDFITYLKSPEAAAILTAKGMVPAK